MGGGKKKRGEKGGKDDGVEMKGRGELEREQREKTLAHTILAHTINFLFLLCIDSEGSFLCECAHDVQY